MEKVRAPPPAPLATLLDTPVFHLGLLIPSLYIKQLGLLLQNF